MGRPAPKFWWDFWYEAGEAPVGIVVQGDWPGGEALAIFRPPEGTKPRSLDREIGHAHALIADYAAGRKTPPWGKPATDGPC